MVKADKFRSKIVLTGFCPFNQEPEIESPGTRLAKHKNAEFTGVNEYFLSEHNEVIGLYRQALTIISLQPHKVNPLSK